jgi:excinuclease ABC subunit A
MLFSRRMGCPDCGVSLLEMSPRLFSFNSPKGWCPACQGLGVHYQPDPERLIPDRSLSLRESGVRLSPREERAAARLLETWKCSPDTPLEELPPKAMHALLHGTGDAGKGGFAGLSAVLRRWFCNENWSEESRIRWIGPYMWALPCSECGGERLNPQARHVLVAGKTLPQLLAMALDECFDWFSALWFNEREQVVASPLLKEILERLSFLKNVGLSYLSLDRPSATLSGGEAQRVRLATQVGSRLRGVLYVLDEPTIGLHRHDNLRLIESLRQLRDLGNTVVVVEHDEDTIRAADYLVDLGPGAGIHGGKLVAHGSPEEVARSGSLTGAYLSGRRSISIPARRALPPRGKSIEIFGASVHNLKDVNVKIPFGLFTVVTGVSGSGKSSLVLDTLYPAAANALHGTSLEAGAHRRISGLKPHYQRAVAVDQSPLGRTPRSNPATYTGAFGVIRDLFASLPAAKMRGFTKSRFSFNLKGGRCEHCKGMGVKKIAMAFMPDQIVPCEACHSSGFNHETLQIRYNGKTIADVLAMTVEEALDFFRAVPRVRDPLETLAETGLGYLKLGQPTVSLSGGEAQRMRLAREIRVLPRLSARHRTTLYIFDEPTIGLHFHDVARLIEILLRLRDNGHTVIVIEHHPDVIKCADWIVDLGPEGGEAGGRILASGSPESVARCKPSHTAALLREVLGRGASPESASENASA